MNSTEKTEKAVRDFLKGVSETNRVYFVGSTTKNPLEYQPNETMTFKLRVKTETEYLPVPFIAYSCEGEDGVKTEGCVSPAEDGWFYFDTSIRRDGFVHVIARACDENKNVIEGIDIFEGGAGAAIDKITMGTEEPTDYLAFWDELKQKVRDTEPEILFQERFERENLTGFELYDMRIKAPDGDFATFFMAYPKNAERGSLKLRVLTHGYGVCDVCQNDACAQEGALTVFISAHAILSRQKPDYYTALYDGPLNGFGFDNAENQDPRTTYWAKMFMRDMQVVRFALENPLWSGKDVLFSGGSMGGMRACNLAAHTGVATECALEIPWFSDLGGHKNCARLYGWRPDYENGVRYFDTAVAAKHLKCPVTISAGLGDYVCPPSGEMALYNAVSTPKQITFIQNQTHPYRPLEPMKYTLRRD